MSGSGARATSRGGGAAQAARSASSNPRRGTLAVDDNGRTWVAIRRDKVGWVLVEIVAVLAIAIAIVWWTVPKKPKPDATPIVKGPPEDTQD
jgi:hypothetical protein